MVRLLLVVLLASVLAAQPAAAQGPGPSPSSTLGSASPVPSASAGAQLELWPAPPDPMERTVAAGLEPLTVESLVHHVHAHLSVFVDGVPVRVPAGIGIDIASPDVRVLDEDPLLGLGYGGIAGCAMPCISPVHTHFETGVIHTESPIAVGNRLGQFFTEWGVRLDAGCVGDFCEPATIAVYVDGEPYEGDPSAIELTDRLVIAIVIGSSPPEIPATYDFSKE